MYVYTIIQLYNKNEHTSKSSHHTTLFADPYLTVNPSPTPVIVNQTHHQNRKGL